MKILFTGGGTGGHFYPIIAIAEELNKLSKEYKLVESELYYMSDIPYNEKLLFDNKIFFIKSNSGKMRRYFSILNFFDIFKTGWGIIRAIFTLFSIYPDVVFGKGGYVSFPVLVAARFLRIPVVIHESDSAPGRVNKWAGGFARKIAVSFPDAAHFFIKDKVAFTGNPVRQELTHPMKEGAHEFLGLESTIPLILILGGSQGSQTINENILDALPKLVEKYQIIHQTGANNLQFVRDTAEVILHNSPHKARFKPFDHLNALSLRMAAGIADLVISRAGSTIFEIAIWGIPSILIPISVSNGDHQRKNAYSYARSGAAEVIEENNLTSHILNAEIERIMGDAALRGKMRKSAHTFARVDAADLIANEILAIAVEHQK